jgi:hypothetical protein
MNILWLLKEHGELSFDEIADIMGSSVDYIDLESRLHTLKENNKIDSYLNYQDVQVYHIVKEA